MMLNMLTAQDSPPQQHYLVHVSLGPTLTNLDQQTLLSFVGVSLVRVAERKPAVTLGRRKASCGHVGRAFSPVLAAWKGFKECSSGSFTEHKELKRLAGHSFRSNLTSHYKFCGWSRKDRFLKFVVNSNLGGELLPPCRTGSGP